MADISDVLDALEQIALGAVFPNGTAQPSISTKIINVAQGWPPSNLVNSALAAGQSLVSIYAVPSSTSKLPVPLASSHEGVSVSPVHGMTATVTTGGFALSGSPATGEFATVIIAGKAYSEAAQLGDLPDGVAARLAGDIAVDWPGATASAGTVTIPGFIGAMIRIGALGTMAPVIDRQRQNVMVSVWAPNPSDRAVLGRALSVVIKRNLTITMPDTSTAIFIVQTENLIDKYQDELAWRRDMVVSCQWDTLDAYQGYEVTSVDVQLNGRAFTF